MTGTRRKENGQFVLSLDAQAVDRYIMDSRIRVGGITHAQGNVWACVIGGIGRRRDGF